MEDNTIGKIHLVQLDLLSKFVDVCERHNLRYTLIAGSLLGAVRHGGFIPWDDDIDVAMPREDYRIFIGIANKILPEGYFLQHYTTEKNCVNVFAKLQNCNTTWIPHETRNLNIHHGIAMDIFPVDRVRNPDKLDKIAKKTYRLIMMNNLCDATYIETIKSKFKRTMAYIIMPFVKMIGHQRLLKKMDKFNCASGEGEWTTADVIFRNKLLPYRIFEQYEEIEFENKKYKCIAEKELYLSTVYGSDYMELPPVDKRRAHIAEIVDCDNSYIKYYDDHGKVIR